MPIIRRKEVAVQQEPGGIRRRNIATREAGTDSLTVSEVTLLPGGGVPLHIHPGHEECILVMQGTLAARLGEETTEVTSGTAIIVPAGVKHTLTNNAPRAARVLAIYPTTNVQRQVVR